MKIALSITIIIGSLITNVYAQWKVIAIKPNSQVYVGDQLLKKGQEIKHTDKIRFTKADQYVRIYEVGKLPFTLKPGGGKKGLSNELEGQAFAMRVIKKRSLIVRGIQPEQFTPYIIMNNTAAKLWCTGTSMNAVDPLKKPRKLLFLEKGKLYFSYKFKSFAQEVTFFYVYKYKGKRVVKPIIFENKPDYKLLKFNPSIYKVGGQQIPADETSGGGLFYRLRGERPLPLSRFKPYVVPKIPTVFKQEVKELLSILKKEMGKNYQSQLAKNLKTASDKQIALIIDLERFRQIMDFTDVFFDARPDFNSLKEWLTKNFPKLQLPKESN